MFEVSSTWYKNLNLLVNKVLKMFKNLKKITVFVILFVFAFTINSSAIFAYDDVDSSSPYFYSIEYLRRNNVFPTKKLFNPENDVTIASFIKYLVLLNDPEFKKEKHDNIKLPYKDTRDNAWYAPYFDDALKLGILTDDENFIYPYKKLNVIDALKLLFNSRGIPVPRKYVGRIPYKDLAKRFSIQGLVMRAIDLGIVKPKQNDFFSLYRKLSRQEAAFMIYKMDLISFRPPKESTSNAQVDNEHLKKIINAWNLITSNYVDPVNIDEEVLSDSAISAMVNSLGDPYSVYYSIKESKMFNDDFDGEFEGIGAYIGLNKEKKIMIVSPIKNSPADKAGIKAGDLIKAVDDVDMTSATLEEVVSKIKGPEDSEVKITVIRNGKTIDIKVIRSKITIDAIEYKFISDDIVYIKLLNFNENAFTELKDLSEVISSNPKVKGIILDVRNNPGGLLNVAVNMLGLFLEKGSTAVNIKYNLYNYAKYTSGDGILKDYPLVVLINSASASASEILAGALSEIGGDKIIGETSYGKGTVQEINYFGDSSSLKITVAKWLTPNLFSIQGNGIEPDITVLNSKNSKTDRQLDRAISELRKLFR